MIVNCLICLLMVVLIVFLLANIFLYKKSLKENLFLIKQNIKTTDWVIY